MDAVRAQAARASPSRAAEIEKEIAAILGGQGLRTVQEIGDRLPTDDAGEALRRQLTRLRAVEKRYQREAIKEKRKRAKDIIKTIDRLQRQIEDAPALLKLGLSLIDLGHLIEPSEIERRRVIRLGEVSSIGTKRFLTMLRRQCEAQLSHLPQSDRLKLECARAAHYLICAYTKGKPASTVNSPFRKITGLLYERVAGVWGADLKRACEKVVKEKTKPEARKHAGFCN